MGVSGGLLRMIGRGGGNVMWWVAFFMEARYNIFYEYNREEAVMEKYIAYVEKHRELILDALDYIWKNPETGYKEWKTHAYLEEAFAKLGYELTLAGDIPGFTALVDTGRPGPTIAVFGEMDSLVCATHPEADPETGAVHACGHCAQAAALLGLAAALKEPGALDEMCGKILLVAVPAEELIEVEYRKSLRDKGIIRYFGGKPEFMHRGLLDGVDMAIMVHTSSASYQAGINGGSNGCIAKTVCFEGVAAHAGGAPHNGVNALYAANLAMNAINALRETFQDSAHIRVHPIITEGGVAVNAIPDTVRMESYVRGATMEEIVKVNRKVNRATAAAAAAMGAKVRLQDVPGYWPRIHSDKGIALVKEAFTQVVDSFDGDARKWGTGCSDMGDVSALMPALHPYVGGAAGASHGNDYRIADPELACVKSAQMQLAFLVTALKNGGEKAQEVIDDYQPVFATMQEYFDYVDKLNLDCQAVDYAADGCVVLRFEEG